MQVGMIGLGRMGANMVRRLERAGIDCVGYDVSSEAIAAVEKDGAQGAAKLEELVAQDPNYVLAHSALAVNLQKLGRPDEAIQHALRVVELEPGDQFSYTQLSVICQRCGKIQQAEDALAKARAIQMGMH